MEALLTNITAEVLKDPRVHDGDVCWVLVSSALVLLMTPGLAFFYGGLVRESNIVNTMMMSLICMGIVSIVWFCVGFTLAFGGEGRIIGNFENAFFLGLDNKRYSGTPIWSMVFATFQMTFAIIAAAIMSGSLVERVRFGPYCILVLLWTLGVYVPLCHWVWGSGGWLEELGVKDFAGGTVVHISSGTSGLVAATVLGPRKHREADHGPNSVPFVLLGAALLWFGWGGFNAGSALAANAVASRAIAATYLAACSSMLTWVVMESVRMRQPSSVGAMVGAVAGLVVITPAAGYVAPWGAVCMGILGAPSCYLAVVTMNKFDRLDDTLDAFGLHGVGGIVGAILTGFFAEIEERGVLYGGSMIFLLNQCLGALVGVAYSALVTAILFGALKLIMRVRVHHHHEQEGVDKHVHGEEAYSSWRPSTGSNTGFNLDEENSTESDEMDEDDAEKSG